MNDAALQSEFKYDAFISYSRKDSEFARRLEQALRTYKPPKDLAIPQRYLRVFRDESDFQGVEYHTSLDRNLREATKLIIICSPNSARSVYVGDEIRRFAQYRGENHIIPILVDGIPNNEAQEEEAGRKAFSEELVKLLPIPLANDYRNFNSRTDKVQRGRFTHAWFKTLADLYADYGVDRSQVEQREQKRRARNRRLVVGTVSAVGAALIALTVWALISRQEARQQRDLALARQYEAEARLAFDDSQDGLDGLVKATFLSVASLRSSWTLDGHILLMRLLNLLPRPPAWRQAFPVTGGMNASGGRIKVIAFSPDGSVLAVASSNEGVQLWDAKTGRVLKTIDDTQSGNSMTTLVFSPDGKFLALGCKYQVCVIDLSGGQVRRLPEGGAHGMMVFSATFSPDSRLLATASYGSSEVHIYDAVTGRLVGRIPHESATSVEVVAFSPDGKALATADGRKLRLWKIGSYEAPSAEIEVGRLLWSIAFWPQGNGLVTAGSPIQPWRLSSDETGASKLEPVKLEPVERKPLEAHTLAVVSGRNDHCFVAGGGAVYLLCGESLKEALRLPVPSAAVAVSPDGHWLVNANNHDLALWPLESGGDVARIRLGSAVNDIAVAVQQDWLAAVTENGIVSIINTKAWEEKQHLKVAASAVGAVRISSDNRWLVVHEEKAVHVIDT